MMRCFLLILICLGLGACSMTLTSKIMTGPIKLPADGDIAVLMEGDSVPSQFEEVGIVQAIGHRKDATPPHLIARLREEAVKLGCTHVIQVKVDQGITTASAIGVAVRVSAGHH